MTTSITSFEIHHGDCLKLFAQLPDSSVDAIITDPPYNSGGASSASRTSGTPNQKYLNEEAKRKYPNFGGDQKDQRGFAFWCHQWLSECHRVSKEGAPILLFSDWRQLPLTTDILQAADFIWRGIVPWDKTGGCRPTRGRFSNQAEYVVWGSKGGMPFDRGPSLPGVYRYPVRQADKYHTTGKPTPLMEDLLQIVPEGALILDPFSGSGTTGVAAARTNRRFIGFEREKIYAEIATSRIQELLQTGN
jgi:site-specific DNA-methyltransferase (adenine-specific)